MKKFLKQIGLLSLALISASSLAQAQITTTPQLLIYEGELLDDTGVPVVGGFTFRFSFWDNGDYEASDVVGGVINAGATDYRGWTEVQTTTTISDGSFSLQMGDVTPFTNGLFDENNLFLQVEVKNAGDPDTAYEFVDINLGDPTDDRKVIASVPFAFNANKLDYRELGFGAGNIPYLDMAGLLPDSVIPDLDLTASDLNLADITLSDFTNDLALNNGQVFIGDAANIANAVNISGDGTLDNTGLFTLALNSIGEDELDFGNVTLADFTNDVGFVTTDTDTLGGLICGINEIPKWDGSTWICSPDAGGAAFTASDGITLTGSNFTNDLGTSIETGEITDGTVTFADLNSTDITLADFTNDAGFITTDGDTLNDLTCAVNEIARFNGTIWVCAGGPVSVTKVLSPRYPSSIFKPDGTNNTGSMYEEEATTLSGILDTVLRWFSRQVVLNDYDIIVEWTIPDDFDSFQTNPLSLDYQTDGTVADALIDMTVQHNSDADDEIIGTGIALNSNTWTTISFVIDGTTTWNVGDTMKIRLIMKAKDSNSAQVGNIKIKYNRK